MARLSSITLSTVESDRMPLRLDVAQHQQQAATLHGHLNVKRASEFDAAFVRRTGWTGADGAYSIAFRDGRTLWLFSDTLIGEVDASRRRTLEQRIPINQAGFPFINNSIAIQETRDPSSMRFITGDKDGVPCSVFTPPDKEEWFWVNDAVLNPDNTITVLLNSFAPRREQCFAFGKPVALWAADLQLLNNEVYVTNYRRIHTVDAADAEGHETVWGAGVLEDGLWTYICGSQLTSDSRSPERGLVVARTPVGRLGDSDAWRFFDGKSFVKDSRQVIALPLPVPNEISIQQLHSSGYLLTFADGYGPICFSFSQVPTGPWSGPQSVWIPTETTDTVYTYNPKAHPGQSDQRGLLISYNVNSYNVHESIIDADIYRPRFIRVPWDSIEVMAENAGTPIARSKISASAA